MSYPSNVKAWWQGFTRFGEIRFRRGWSATSWRWRALYWADYGTRVLTGGACVSWSRWWYERRKKLGSAGFMTRILNHLQEQHGARAGSALWGTQDTSWANAGSLVFWPLASAVVFLLVRVLVVAVQRWLA